MDANQRLMNLIEIKSCEDTIPGQQLEAAYQHHSDLGKNTIGKAETLHTILLGKLGTCCNELNKSNTK
eukprot:956918-Pelagomonas_calceolata.AAC.1